MRSGSYFFIHSNEFDQADNIIKAFGGKIKSQDQGQFKKDELKKVWHQKYFFFGPIKVAIFKLDDWTFLYEPYPSTLFYSDYASKSLSTSLQKNIICYFNYPEASATGITIFENGQIKRKLISEIDYKVCESHGDMLPFETEIEFMGLFNETHLKTFLKHLQCPYDPLDNDDIKKVQGKIIQMKR